MTAEILFENLMLYADEMNVRYLKQCMPDAQFIGTELNERPYFADNTPDLIYMGGMNEKNQEKAIEMLLPFKDRLEKLVDSGAVMLFTSNAVECLGQYIQEDDKQIPALGLFDIYAKREMFNRYGGEVLGTFEGISIVGFKNQFAHTYGKTDDYPFISVERGIGLNKKTKNEGIRKNNLMATYLVGPFLVINPLFTKYLLRLLGHDDKLPFEDVAMAAYSNRLEEFKDPQRKIG